jgi:hypothetical protein
VKDTAATLVVKRIVIFFTISARNSLPFKRPINVYLLIDDDFCRKEIAFVYSMILYYVICYETPETMHPTAEAGTRSEQRAHPLVCPACVQL